MWLVPDFLAEKSLEGDIPTELKERAWDNAGMANGELFIASTGTGPPGTFAVELCEGGSEPLFA